MKKDDIFNFISQFEYSKEKITDGDLIIFSRISYFPFEKFIKNEQKISLNKAFDLMTEAKITKSDFIWQADYKLFEKIQKSHRYDKIKLFQFENSFDPEKQIQFAAITINFNGKNYISFRGTDQTITGWKEDFNMAFLETVPAQKLAVEYVNKIRKKYILTKNILLGHSKGGNLAVYAGVKANFLTKKSIQEIYNFDGPGFLTNFIESKDYKRSKAKIKIIIPENSVVGRLLNQQNYLVVKSRGLFALQHMNLLWNIENGKFEYIRKNSKGSDKIDKTLDDWLTKMTLEERSHVIELIYQILSQSDVKNLLDIIKKLPLLIKNSAKANSENKQFINSILNKLADSIKNY